MNVDQPEKKSNSAIAISVLPPKGANHSRNRLNRKQDESTEIELPVRENEESVLELNESIESYNSKSDKTRQDSGIYYINLY